MQRLEHSVGPSQPGAHSRSPAPGRWRQGWGWGPLAWTGVWATLCGSQRGHPGSRTLWGKPEQGGGKQGDTLGDRENLEGEAECVPDSGEGGPPSLQHQGPERKQPSGGASTGDTCGDQGLVFTPELRVGRNPPPPRQAGLLLKP